MKYTQWVIETPLNTMDGATTQYSDVLDRNESSDSGFFAYVLVTSLIFIPIHSVLDHIVL